MATMDGVSKNQLSLTVNAKRVPLFFQLLGHGFCVCVQTGCSVKEMLCNQLGIHEDYLAQRIKTIFLNAKVVDDVNSAIVDKDATMALSGAMPGLVGAILRSGGFYAPMRSQISHEENRPASQSQLKKGKITLKLWNLVVKELGPTFLQQGVWIQGQEVQSFIERHGEELKAGCVSAELNDQPADVDRLCKTDWKTNLVFLQVKSEQAV
ncbi:MAG: hypothetical protein WBM69_00815 [Desulfobacterales bacterium]